MRDEATARRLRDQEELENPLGLWYLSFSGEEGFRGAVIVEAHGVTTAVDVAWVLGINPGGEVLAIPCPFPVFPELQNRLLGKDELAVAFGELQVARQGWIRKGVRAIICIRQEDTWHWPPYLDKQMAGECSVCHAPIYYERKNEKYRKMCAQCWAVQP